ncbi:MAG: DUF433 domain-containing protein [Nostoc sp.]|uniref:DUF433 domain-containing protein n=1 Tax=Nostoc sp. TaxID=1180 RepID=UPI002FF35CEB
MVQATEHIYIVMDDAILGGEPIIRGTRTPVRAIVETSVALHLKLVGIRLLLLIIAL